MQKRQTRPTRQTSEPKTSPSAQSISLVLAGVIVGIVVTLIIMQSHKTEFASDAHPIGIADKSSAAAVAAPSVPAPASAPSPGGTFSSGFGSPNTNPFSTQAMPPAPGEMTSQTSQPPAGRDIQYGQSGSGYVIYTGRKAVDSDQPVNLGNGAPVVTDETGAYVNVAPPPIMRNGLRGNGCVDPPSTFGQAYGRAGLH